MTKEQLNKNYTKAVNDYIRSFCDKHGFEFEGWVGNEAGTVAFCSDYCVDMQTIIDDIELDAPEDEFFKWYDYTVELGLLEVEGLPNFRSWLKGCPRKSESEIEEIRAAHERVEESKRILEKLINKDNKK